MNIFEKVKQYQALFIAGSTLFIFFICYLFIDFATENRTISDIQYINAVDQLFNQLDSKKQHIDHVNSLSTLSETQLNNLQESIISNSDLIASLEVLKNGGELNLGNDKLLTIQPASVFWDSQATGNTIDIINVLNATISALTANQPDKALESFSSITDDLHTKRDKKIRLLKLLHIIGGFFALVFYFGLFIPALLRLSKTGDVKKDVENEVEGIMNTISEGLFLLEPNYQIGVEQSSSLRDIFKLDRDLNGDFLEFMRNYVPESTLSVARDYLDLLFGERVKEKLVGDLNPLLKVEISIVRRDGSVESNYLDFKFKRVVTKGRLSHLLVSVTDITRQVSLEKELEQTKDEQEAQLQLLLSVLHVDRNKLDDFLNRADSDLSDVNNKLKDSGHDDVHIRKNLKDIMVVIHKLKGDAAALNLSSFEFQAHDLESEIVNVMETHKIISGKELLEAVSELKALFRELHNLRDLVERFSTTFNKQQDGDIESASNSSTLMPEASLMSKSFDTIVSSVAERQNVDVTLTSWGFDDKNIPENLSHSVETITTQLLRNSVVHGAETPEQRRTSGKPPSLNILTVFSETEEGYILEVRDDGKGADARQVWQRAIELGVVSETAVMPTKSKSILSLLFHPGFTSSTQADLDSGRGVGLTAVHKIVRENKGKISISQQHGLFWRILVSFPKNIIPKIEPVLRLQG